MSVTLSPAVREAALKGARTAEALALEAQHMAVLYRRIANALPVMTDWKAQDILDTGGTENAVTGLMADLSAAILALGETS